MATYKYLIFKNYGQFGNQIFQYAALKKLAKNSNNVICYGFEDFHQAFENIDVRMINSSTPNNLILIYNILYKIANYLSQKKVVSRVGELKKIDETELIESKGFFKNFAFVDKSYFQSEKYFNSSDIKHLSLKSGLREYASDQVRSLCGDNVPIFVHIRRQDYVKWPTRENPAILPAAYYEKCINIIKKHVANPFFFLTSDDTYYARDIFTDLKNSYISSGSSLEDFALMTQCHGGILSASSFAWWAAYFAKLNHNQSFFLAPKYWGGCRMQRWYPASVKSSFLNYIEI